MTLFAGRVQESRVSAKLFGVETRQFSSCSRELFFLVLRIAVISALFVLGHQRLLLAFQFDSACRKESVSRISPT
jgi:hypothetical protein